MLSIGLACPLITPSCHIEGCPVLGHVQTPLHFLTAASSMFNVHSVSCGHVRSCSWFLVQASISIHTGFSGIPAVWFWVPSFLHPSTNAIVSSLKKCTVLQRLHLLIVLFRQYFHCHCISFFFIASDTHADEFSMYSLFWIVLHNSSLCCYILCL